MTTKIPESIPVFDKKLNPRGLKNIADYSALNEQQLLDEIGKIKIAKIDKQILTHFDYLVQELDDRFPKWHTKKENRRELEYFNHLRWRLTDLNFFRKNQHDRIITSTSIQKGYVKSELNNGKSDLISEWVRLSKDDEMMKALVKAGIVNQEEYKYMEAMQRDLARMDRVVLQGTGWHSYYIAEVKDGVARPDTSTAYERAFDKTNSRDLIDVVRVTSLIRNTFTFNEKGLVGERGLIEHLLENQVILDTHGDRIQDAELLLVDRANVLKQIEDKIKQATSTDPNNAHDVSIQNYKELQFLRDFVGTKNNIRIDRNRKMLQQVNEFRVFLKTNALIPGLRDEGWDISEEGTLGIIDKFVSNTQFAAIIGSIVALFTWHKKSALMLFVYGLAGTHAVDAWIALAWGKKKSNWSDDDLNLIRLGDITPTLEKDYKNPGYSAMLPEIIEANKDLTENKTKKDKVSTIQTLPWNAIIGQVFQKFIDMTEKPQMVGGVAKNPLDGILLWDISMDTANKIHWYLVGIGETSVTDGYGGKREITPKYVQSMLYLLNQKKDSADTMLIDTLTKGGLDISIQRYDDVEFIEDGNDGEDIFNDELNQILNQAFTWVSGIPVSREEKMDVVHAVNNLKRLNPKWYEMAWKGAKSVVTDVPSSFTAVLSELAANTPLNNKIRPIVEKYQEFTELDDELKKHEGPIGELAAPLKESTAWLTKKAWTKADKILAIHDVIAVYEDEKKELQKIVVPSATTTWVDYFIELRKRYELRLQEIEQMIATNKQAIQDLLVTTWANVASVSMTWFSSSDPEKVEELYEHMEDQIKVVTDTNLNSIADVKKALGKTKFVRALEDLDVYADPTTGLTSMTPINPSTTSTPQPPQALRKVFSLQSLIAARAPDLVSWGTVDIPKIKGDIETVLSDHYTERQTEFSAISGINVSLSSLQNNTDTAKIFIDLQKWQTANNIDKDDKMLEAAKKLNLTLPTGVSNITTEKFAQELAKKLKAIEATLPQVRYENLPYTDALALLRTTREGVNDAFDTNVINKIWDYATVKSWFAQPKPLHNLRKDLDNSLAAVLDKKLNSINASSTSTSTFETQVRNISNVIYDAERIIWDFVNGNVDQSTPAWNTDFEILDPTKQLMIQKMETAIASYLEFIKTMPVSTVTEIEDKIRDLDALDSRIGGLLQENMINHMWVTIQAIRPINGKNLTAEITEMKQKIEDDLRGSITQMSPTNYTGFAANMTYLKGIRRDISRLGFDSIDENRIDGKMKSIREDFLKTYNVTTAWFSTTDEGTLNGYRGNFIQGLSTTTQGTRAGASLEWLIEMAKAYAWVVNASDIIQFFKTKKLID